MPTAKHVVDKKRRTDSESADENVPGMLGRLFIFDNSWVQMCFPAAAALLVTAVHYQSKMPFIEREGEASQFWWIHFKSPLKSRILFFLDCQSNT